MAESTASLREEILALSGVDIMKNANEFKSTYAIMDELADKWEGLSDISQATITELIAGKHQGNVMSSLMTNFDIARKALETSQNSAGSAMAEHAKWSDSLEARLNKLKATWQSLSQSFMSSGFLKGGIGAITSLANGVDVLVSKFGALPTLIGTFAAGLSLFKNKGIFTFDKSTNSIQAFNIELSNMVKTYSSLKSTIGDYNFLASQQKSLTKQQSLISSLSKGNKGATQVRQQELIKQQSQLERQQKQLAKTQENFNKGISQSNSNLANYFSSLNGGKASIAGYVASLVGAKVATFALQAATLALNAALTMGISALVSWGVSALSKWINEAGELAEKVDETTSKYKDQHKALVDMKKDYDTSKEDSMISKYEELSKGVDAFGRNLSLTADEYAEYQNIVNTIADQIPSLVSGYDSQGNAILSCAGNVKDLTTAYEDLIRKQNEAILIDSSGDINKDFKNAVKDAEHNTEGWFGWNWTQELNLGSKKLSTESAEIFENILNAEDSASEFNKALRDSGNKLEGIDVDAMSKLLENAGFERNGNLLSGETSTEHVRRAFEENKAAVKGILSSYYSDLEIEVEGKKTQAQAALSNALDLSDSMYHGMSDTMKNIARQTVGSFDFGFFKSLEDQGVSVENYINNMLDSLNSLSKMDESSIETAFNLRTQFNGGDISYGEYVNSIQEVGGLIDKLSLPDTVKDTIKNALNIDGIVEQYNALSKRLQDDFKWSESAAKDFLGGLSAEEFAVAMNIIPNLDGSFTASELQDMIDKEMALQGLTVKVSLEVEKANIEALTTALSEMVSGAGMSSESISAVEGMFKDMEGYDPAKLFERTANGIKLNREEFSKLNSEYSKTNLAELNREMSSLGDIYNQTREELYKLAYGTDEYDAKLADLNSIESRINELEQLTSQYQGLTSAYQQWQMAESTGNERDMYESVISGIAAVKDEISRGWVDDGTREFIELIKGETATIIDGDGAKKEIDIATASAKELKQVMDDLDKKIEHTAEGGHKGYSISDFFTTDKDGNSTSKGVYNFLDAIGHMEEEVFGGTDIVQRDGKGNIIGFNFDLVGGDKVIAEALGVSEELVQIMVRAADDAGFVVNFDGTYQQLDVLREKAQLAATSMNEILEKDGKKTINIDMNADTVKEIQPQIDSIMETFGKKDGSGKLTGEIDMSVNGAEQALTVVSTLQSMKDRLERPAYMNIQTSQVEDDLKEPLQNLQDYRTGIEQLNQAKLHGADTTELEASIKESKDKVVADLQEIQENNPELAAELKIDGLSESEIASKVENNEITIPASIEVQMSIDDKLGILADKALLDAGLIKPEEFEKRVEIYLDTNVDDDDAKETIDNAVNEVTEGSGGETTTVTKTVDAEVETGEVKTKGFFGKLWDNIKEVFTNGSAKDGIETGSSGQLTYRFGVNADGTVQSVTIEGEEKVDEAIKNETGETKTVETNANVSVNAGNIDTSGVDSAVDNAVGEDVGTTKKQDVEVTAKVTGANEVKSLKTTLEQLKDKTVNIIVSGAEAALGLINSIKAALESIDSNKEININANSPQSDGASATGTINWENNVEPPTGLNADGTINWTNEYTIPTGLTADGTINWSNNYSIPSGLTTTGTINWVNAGIGGANGTAHVGGTAFVNGTVGRAFKQGDWGTKDSGVALGGELGTETIVRDGRFFTIGDHGAEFFHYKKGDIIFNHRQTEELFKNGYVTSGGGRGKALASGTAFADGTAFSSGTGGGIKPSPTYSGSSKKSKSSGGSGGSGENEVFDWIEKLLERFDRAIDMLDKAANNIYKSFDKRNTSLSDEISKVTEQISNQQKAYEMYMHEAEHVGKDGSFDLTEEWKEKIRNGDFHVDVLNDEKLIEYMGYYQEWYEKALEAEEALQELKETLSSLYALKVENIATQYEGILGVIEHERNILEEYINQSEAQSWLVSAKYYDALAKNERETITELENQKAEMLVAFNEAMDSGTIDEGSESW